MNAITFDTHKFVKKLQEAGMPPAQAEALADIQSEVLSGAFEAKFKDLATKADLTKLEGEMVLVKWMLGLILAGVASLILKSFF